MIVDSHVHVFPAFIRENRERYFPGEPAFKLLYDSPKARLAGREALLRDMDREGVDRAVVFGFPWEDEETFRRHNDYVMESTARHSDRLTGLGCFSLTAPGGAAEADRCLKGGLAGVGELAVYGREFSVEGLPVLSEVMAVCLEQDAPVLLHTNEPVGHNYPGKTSMRLSEVYAFVKAHPRNRIILAHWGGGLFFYALMKKEVQEALNHVWFDTAASPFLYRQQIYKTAVEIAGPDRFLFGSDYPLIHFERYRTEIHGAGLSREAENRILGENAASLFNLYPSFSEHA